MKVTYINAPIAIDEPVSEGTYHNLGLGYLTSYLHQERKNDFHFIDPRPMGMSLKGIIHETMDYDPGMVCLSSSSPSFPFAKSVATGLRDAGYKKPILEFQLKVQLL